MFVAVALFLQKKRQWMWNDFYYWFKGNGKNETLPSEVFYCLAKSFEVVTKDYIDLNGSSGY